MKISIITAVLNRERTIGQAIKSVLDQTHRDIELIVMDGGSVDGTLEVLRSFNDERIRLFSQPDLGIYDALNRGIAIATGEVVGIVHSDDFLAHDLVIARVVEAFALSSPDAVYGDLDYVSSSAPGRVVRSWRSVQFEPAKLAHGWMPPHPSLFIKRSVFTRLGGYDISYRISADYEAILRYFGSDGFAAIHVPEVFVKMRLGGVSNRSLRHIVLKSKEDFVALKTHGIGGYAALTKKNLSKIPQFFRQI